MLKNMLVAVAATCGGMAATVALAGTPYNCTPADLAVTPGAPAQFVITCTAADTKALSPSVKFAGSLPTVGNAPYPVNATYHIDSQSSHAKIVDSPLFADQHASGKIKGSTSSIAALPAQYANYLIWDDTSSVLSVKEAPHKWRAFSVNPLDLTGSTLIEAGIASEPVVDGKAAVVWTFDKDYSRFAGKGADQPTVSAVVGIRNGRMELLLGDSRVNAQDTLRNAVLKLDQRPSDMSRAWNLAAVAQFFNMPAERKYAEAKVAAHNPQLLAEFVQNVERVPSYASALSPAK